MARHPKMKKSTRENTGILNAARDRKWRTRLPSESDILEAINASRARVRPARLNSIVQQYPLRRVRLLVLPLPGNRHALLAEDSRRRIGIAGGRPWSGPYRGVRRACSGAGKRF